MDLYKPLLEWLVELRSIKTDLEYQRAAKAIMEASIKYPNFYKQHCISDVDTIKKQVFKAEVLANYMRGYCGLNEMSSYDQDIVRNLMDLRRAEMKS